MGKKRSASDAPAGAARPFHDAFARLRERLPEGFAPASGDPVPPPRAPGGEGAPVAGARTAGAGGPARAVVRIERKGRGGKEATVVERLELAPAALSAWLDEVKRALGCGGAVEGGTLVLQGDQRERVARWLERRGVRKVTVGT